MEMGGVVDGEWVLLCNAVEGCVVGKVEKGLSKTDGIALEE